MPIDWIKDSVPNFLKVTQITRHLIKIGGHNSQNDKDEDISSTINNVNNNWEIKAEIDNSNRKLTTETTLSLLIYIAKRFYSTF